MPLSPQVLERLYALLQHDDAAIRSHGAELLRALPRAVLWPHLISRRLAAIPLAGLDLSGADLSGADLSDMDLGGVDLSGADLSGANLSGTKLDDANLRGACLAGADLSRARLVIADLTNANLTDADLTDAETRGTLGLAGPTWTAALRWQPPQSRRCYVSLSPRRPVVIGTRRTRDITVRIYTDDQVSSRHCRIRWEDDRWVLHNLTSAGTFVRGLPVGTHTLAHRDVFVIGKTLMTFFSW